MSPVLVTRAAEETERLGEALAGALEAGDLIALSGPLGAGKTRFVTGLARGLACKARVRSPTFALVNEYHGRLLLVHLDLYRLEPREVEGLGLDEYAERGALVVEWAEKLPDAWLAQALRIDLTPGAEADERRLEAQASSGRGLALRSAWERIAAATREGAA